MIFIVPIAIFLAVQYFSQAGRQKGHWPQPRQQEQSTPESAEAESTTPPRARRRKTRVRTPRGPDCGREVTHVLLTLVAARDSCRYCAALRAEHPKEPIDLVAEAERIANEAQD
ncbi:MAG: hypothetical protein ACE5EF_05435 [Dehalococcoidia bacterium]